MKSLLQKLEGKLSTYSVQRYIQKKFDDIQKDTPAAKAYTLGIAVGMLECYKGIKKMDSKETADKCFDNLDKNEEYTVILRTLIGIENEESRTKAEKLAEKIQSLKKPEKKLEDDDRDFLEEFMEFLYKKEK